MPVKRKSALKKSSRASKKAAGLDFSALVDGIRQIHEQSAAAVNRVVNTTLTLRNWAIGAYIHHYELNGADRAEYGEGLLDRLAAMLSGEGVPACQRRQLYVYRQFFQAYPQILETLSPQFPQASEIVRSLTAQSNALLKTSSLEKVRSVTAQSERVRGAEILR